LGGKKTTTHDRAELTLKKENQLCVVAEPPGKKANTRWAIQGGEKRMTAASSGGQGKRGGKIGWSIAHEETKIRFQGLPVKSR